MAAKTKSVTRYVKVTKTRRRRNNGFTLPLAIVAGFYPLVNQGLSGWDVGGLRGGLKQMTLALTGYDTDTSTWHPEWLKAGLYPVIFGMLVHWGAKKVGLNRALGAAGMPVLRV